MTDSVSPLRLSIPDGSLQVEFLWQDDRFVHQFVLPDGSSVISIEGTTADVWPPSPPLQQLSLERIDQADVILGVGAAGQAHWSISVEVGEKQQRQVIKFDLACRSKSPPQWLGNTYPRCDALRFDVDENTTASEQEKLVIEPLPNPAHQTHRWGFCVSVEQTDD